MQSTLKYCQKQTLPRRCLHNGYITYHLNSSWVVFKNNIEYADFYSLWSANQFSIEQGKIMLSESVAKLSSGHYYDTVEEWYLKLTEVLNAHDIVPDPLPTIHGDEGRGYIDTDDLRRVFFTWYKMPETGHWEIICYMVKGY